MSAGDAWPMNDSVNVGLSSTVAAMGKPLIYAASPS